MSGFRLDRSATVLAVYPLLRISQAEGRFLPVLMYHSISEDDEPGVAPYYKTATRPAVFAAHMEWLHRSGYQAADLETAIQLFQRNSPKAAKVAAITFDDGYEDFAVHAFPALARHGFSASVYLPVAHIDDRGADFKGKRCLTWSQVRELRREGIIFGSHTVSHPRLVNLPHDEVKRELIESKAVLEARLNEPITTFAYPYAFPQTNRAFVARFKSLLSEAGYAFGVTTRIGCFRPNDDPRTIARLPANSCDDLALFEAKIKGAYDWLAYPQTALKTIKSWVSRRPSAECVS